MSRPTLVVGAADLALPRAQTRHALRALRLRQGGDALTLFNGRGGEYLGAADRGARARGGRCRSFASIRANAELPWPIAVAQGLSSGDKMDWTVEKSVELGASAVAPLGMARSVRAPDRRPRRQRDARTGRRWRSRPAEQCGRNRIAADRAGAARLRTGSPRIPEATLQARSCSPTGRAVARRCADRRPERRVVLLVGPEGGFAENELHGDRRSCRLPCRCRSVRASCAPRPRRRAALAMLSVALGRQRTRSEPLVTGAGR